MFRKLSHTVTRRAPVVFVGLMIALSAGASKAGAQINMAALAQFKKNQQVALAKQLQGSAATTQEKSGTVGRHGKKKANEPMLVPKPPMIKAQNRSFKGNFTDMRKSNMR
jgi:hypothetical protein